MFAKLKKLIWVFTTFRTPLLFLRTLYRTERGRVILSTWSGLQIEVRQNRWDSSIVMEMFHGCPYLEGADLKAGAVVVDIGGYIADFSMLVAKDFGARVYAFEPTPDNFAMAKANVARNGLADKIELHNMAIGDGSPVTLYVRRESDEMHVTFEPAPGAVAEQVPSLSLATALAMAKSDIDLLKIDCEGFEYSIVEAAGIADFARVRRMSLEYHEIAGWQAKLSQMKEKLVAAGFSITDRYPYLYCGRQP